MQSVNVIKLTYLTLSGPLPMKYLPFEIFNPDRHGIVAKGSAFFQSENKYMILFS
jgi:hypothetical protein